MKPKQKSFLQNLDWVTTILPFGCITLLCCLFMIFPEGSANILASIRFFLGDQLGSYYLLMGLGALFFLLGGLFYDEGVRLETNVITWLYIGGLALPATAISNITLVKAVKLAGPTLTSLLGALEPLTAVLVGVFVFKELFTTYSALGIILVVISVSLVLFQQKRTYT